MNFDAFLIIIRVLGRTYESSPYESFGLSVVFALYFVEDNHRALSGLLLSGESKNIEDRSLACFCPFEGE